jgi:hypothetical protein
MLCVRVQPCKQGLGDAACLLCMPGAVYFHMPRTLHPHRHAPAASTAVLSVGSSSKMSEATRNAMPLPTTIWGCSHQGW